MSPKIFENESAIQELRYAPSFLSIHIHVPQIHRCATDDLVTFEIFANVVFLSNFPSTILLWFVVFNLRFHLPQVILSKAIIILLCAIPFLLRHTLKYTAVIILFGKKNDIG